MTEQEKKNCTTIFLLPGIGHTRQELLKFGFLAAYLDDVNHEVHYEESVYLLFKPENAQVFQKFLENEYKTGSRIVEDYDYEGGYVVVVYKINEKYLPEYQLFLQGKYSEFAKEYIDKFPTEIIVQDQAGMPVLKKSLHYHIFNRTKEIKEYWENKVGEKLPKNMELWSAPDMSKEVLDITLYQEKTV
jgi:hypothetical protein